MTDLVSLQDLPLKKGTTQDVTGNHFASALSCGCSA